MSKEINSFKGKNVEGFCSSSQMNVVIDEKRWPVVMQFNRMHQLHDISPRVLETQERSIHLFDDLHGRTRDAVNEYFMCI